MAISPPSPRDLAAFKALSNVWDVAAFFNTTRKRLLYLLYARGGPGYRVFLIHKASGGKRRIASPPPTIAVFQRKLLSCMTEMVVPKPPVHGFAQDRSVVTNAKVHLNTKLILNIDLLDFFPTFNFGRVRGMFRSRPFSFPDKVASVLAQTCCFGGSLPQGGPTSPMISNIICRGLDRDLARLASNHSCRYTRYADDITFSTTKDGFPTALAATPPTLQDPTLTLGADLFAVLKKHSLILNSQKSRMRRKSERQVVTGIIVNEKINVPRDYVRNIRSILHDCESNGMLKANLKFLQKDKKKARVGASPPVLVHLRGKLDYLRMVRGADDPIYARLAIRAEKLSTTKKHGVEIFGRSFERNDLLANAIWVVIGINQNGDRVAQGTAFTLKGTGIVSAHHVFEKGKKDGAYRWWLHNAAEPVKTYPLTAYRAHPDVDLAVLESSAPTLAALCRDTKGPQARDRVWIAGFPNWHFVADKLLVEPADVVQMIYVKGLNYVLTNGNIRGGNSGGPFISRDGYVIGVVLGDYHHPVAPEGGLTIDHVDLAAAAPLQVL
jgi:RNA-directed DNA polymerase